MRQVKEKGFNNFPGFKKTGEGGGQGVVPAPHRVGAPGGILPQFPLAFLAWKNKCHVGHS